MKTLKLIAIAGATAALGLVSLPAQASLIITPSNVGTDVWEAESGQSIPTLTAGYVGGTLIAQDAGWYRFTYGPGDLLPGATGHGDSTFINEFWVGNNVFCTQADAACGGTASSVGDSFEVFFAANTAIDFKFLFGNGSPSNELDNGVPNNDIGAYLAQIGLGTTANAGPGSVAYLGLSDHQYLGPCAPTVACGDHDFQDLTVRVTEVPEPLTLSLFGAGLAGAAALRRRKKKSA